MTQPTLVNYDRPDIYFKGLAKKTRRNYPDEKWKDKFRF